MLPARRAASPRRRNCWSRRYGTEICELQDGAVAGVRLRTTGAQVPGVREQLEALADRCRPKAPGKLIGKRIIDAIPYGSRLAALMAHLTVDEITDPHGYAANVKITEKHHRD